MADPIEWTSHPARRRPRDLALVLCVLLLTTGAVLSTLQSLYLAMLAAIILLVSISSFLFPTRYQVSAWGIRLARVGRHQARPWSELRRMEFGPRAAMLSPFARASWMDRHRGMVLLFDGADRKTVVSALEQHFEAQKGSRA